jgi:hypothetical protein
VRRNVSLACTPRAVAFTKETALTHPVPAPFFFTKRKTATRKCNSVDRTRNRSCLFIYLFANDGLWYADDVNSADSFTRDQSMILLSHEHRPILSITHDGDWAFDKLLRRGRGARRPRGHLFRPGGPRGGGATRGCARRRHRRTGRVVLQASSSASSPVHRMPGGGARPREEKQAASGARARLFVPLFFHACPPPSRLTAVGEPANHVGPEEWGYMSVSGWPGAWAVERGPRTAVV